MVLKSALAVAFACSLAGTGCGTGVTAGDTYEHPLHGPFGATLIASPAIPTSANPILGILWSDPLQERSDAPMPREWFATDLSFDKLSGFTITLYRPPPPAAIVRIAAPGGNDYADVALADVVIVDDKDGSGFRPSGIHAEIGTDNTYMAGSEHALVYVARPFSGAVPPSFPLGTLRSGYTIVDFQCSGQVSPGVREVASMVFLAQPSHRLPEIRNCRRTHSP